MAKKKVNYLSDVPKTESKDIPHMSSGTVEINIYKINVTSNSTYVVNSKAGGEKNHYRLDYSSLIPKGGSCRAFAMRDGEDLIFVAKISDGSKIVKSITTTFQNYYHWSTAKVVHIDNRWAGMYEYWFDGSNRYYEWNGDELRFNPYATSAYVPYEYMSGYISDEDHYRIAGSKKADVYRLAYEDGYVYDEAGNDKYTVVNAAAPTIYDYAGNDVYSATGSRVDVYDFKGNDKYMSYSEGNYTVEDYAGNDSYQVYDGCNDITVEDFAGNDKYLAVQCADSLMLYDYKGNDNYNIMSAQYLDIGDDAGNDTYTISYSYKAGSSDSACTNIVDYKGKDTYNITNVDRLFIEEGKSGETNGGNDTYNLTKVVNTGTDTSIINDYSGDDKYTIRYSDYLEINESRGSDKYLITDHSDITRIDDYLGNDVYTISNYSSLDDYLRDYDGKDKYTVTDQSYAYIEDEGKANDTFNVFANSHASIYDEDGNDTYNVDLSSIVEIDDKGGKDTLKITGSDKSNLIFMANYTDNDGKAGIKGVYDGSLLIFDKSQNGYVVIEKYFQTVGMMGQQGLLPTYADGAIENVYAGKSNVSGDIMSYAQGYSAIQSEVAQWLTDNGYNSVIDMVNSGDTTDINDFISTFTTAS